MKKPISSTGLVLEVLTGVALWAIVVLLALGALERNFLSSATLSYASSLIGYLMAGIMLLGSCLAVIDRGHVEIDLLSRQYGGIVAKLAKALFRALAVIAGLLLLAGGIALVSQSLRTGRIDYGLITMPIWVPQLLIPIGGGLMAILFAITDYDLENPEELPPE